MHHDYYHQHQFRSEQHRMVRELELKRAVEANGLVLTRDRFARVRALARRLGVALRRREAAADAQAIEGGSVLSP